MLRRLIRRPATLAVLALVPLLVPVLSLGEEGMFPMSELKKLDLEAAGLEIDPRLIYNPEGLSLVDGICKIGGCTGSFVSDRGLMLTNHHCAFRAIRDASDPENDYLADGFVARSLEDEVPAVGFTVRITESYRDVSAGVLAVVQDGMTPIERTRAIEKRLKELSLAEEEANPGKRCDISEMFQGKAYVLFTYTYLKDVRLVYAPPQSIGSFGGEEDNWMWPRHSGDFSFMRAYVAPDGSSAEYAEQNVPYRPRQILEVAGEGVAEGDFVFLFGYPGSTFRHRSAAYLENVSDFFMPSVVDWYGWQIANLEASAEDDRARQLALADRVKSLHNTYKNFQGKLQGIERLSLVEKRRAEEEALARFIAADPELESRFGEVLPGLQEYYCKLNETIGFELWLRYLLNHSKTMNAALTVYENSIEKTRPEADREWSYMERNLDRTRDDLKVMAENHDPEADALIMAELLRRAGDIPAAAELEPFGGMTGEEGRRKARRFLDEAFARSRLMDPEFLLNAMDRDTRWLELRRDPFLDLVAEIFPAYLEVRKAGKERKGRLDPLLAGLQEMRSLYMGQEFVPDANGTLRFTYGRIEGYSPRDAVWMRPFTRLEGILEKETGQAPFAIPAGFRELVERREFGPFAQEDIGGVPVNMLYSTDTTGGNSGSPVLNARGQVVGLNFDRAWEATINDFAWDHSYSRSIGVDIRYVLWVTWKIGGAERLLREMGVALD